MNKVKLKKYISNALYMLLEQSVKSLFGIFVGVYVARHLGADDFGRLSYIISVSAIVGAISRLGLDGVVIRELAKNKSSASGIISSAFLMLQIGAVLNLFVIVLYVFVSGNEQILFMFIIMAVGVFFQAFGVIDWYFQYALRANLTAIIRLSASVFANVIRLLFIYFDGDFKYFVIVIVLESVFMAVFYVIYAKKENIPKYTSGYKKEICLGLIKSSWPMILMGFSVSMYGKFDQIILNYYYGSNVVGQYAAAVKIFESWVALPYMLTMQLIPAIVKARDKSEKEYIKRLAYMYRIIVGASIIFCGCIGVFSKTFIQWCYGDGFGIAVEVLPMVMASAVFATIISCNTRILISENHEKIVAVRSLLAMIFSVGLSIFIIPAYGANGAAFSTMVALFFSSIVVEFLPKISNKLMRKSKLVALMPFFNRE